MKTLRSFPANFPSLFEHNSVWNGSASSEKTGGRGDCSESVFQARPSDAVVVSAVKGGRLVATVELTGMSDTNEVLGAATAALRHIGGLVTLRLRNRTQGTTCRRVVMLGRVATPFPFRAGGAAAGTAS